MIKKFFTIFTLLIIMAIVLRIFVLPNYFDRGKKRQNINYPSLIYEHEVSAKLQQLGVPHKIDEDGTLLFSRFNEEIVERVYKEVENKYFPEWGNYSFRIEKYKNQFTSLLEENNIPYIVRKLEAEGHEYILWDPMCDEKATALKEKVLKDMLTAIGKEQI